MNYDCHIHNFGEQCGGFLVGLEGNPHFENTLNNDDVLKYHDPDSNLISFLYIQNEKLLDQTTHLYLKYHPRREKYSPNAVIESINFLKPYCVMIDTLNEPFWTAYDYWQIASRFPNIIFIFPHAGGYLINEFIKICHFQKNVYIDYSLTHTILGKYGSRDGLRYVSDAIEFSLQSPFRERVLLSSDYPFFSQNDVYNYYDKLHSIDLLNSNFRKLMEVLK